MSAATQVEVKPKRIQRKRTKGWTMPENAVYVGRPTMYGNPFTVGQPLGDGLQPWVYEAADRRGVDRRTPLTGEQVLGLFRAYMEINEGLFIQEMKLRQIRGKDLACWCRLDQPCHADILLELANQ